MPHMGRNINSKTYYKKEGVTVRPERCRFFP